MLRLVCRSNLLPPRVQCFKFRNVSKRQFSEHTPQPATEAAPKVVKPLPPPSPRPPNYQRSMNHIPPPPPTEEPPVDVLRHRILPLIFVGIVAFILYEQNTYDPEKDKVHEGSFEMQEFRERLRLLQPHAGGSQVPNSSSATPGAGTGAN